MSYKAIYAYPWDVAEIGVSAAVDRFLALGLDTVTITGSYHAGKFLRPHGKGGKVHFPEDGTIYFKPDLSRYGAIKPVENAMLASGQDIVRELVGQSRIATNVWLVLLHNTRLGLAYPDSTVANAFGDRYIYNLCPSAPEARAYAIGLARDVTESIQSAAYPWRPRASCRTRMATITSSRSIGPIAGSTASSAFASARIAGRARRAPEFRSKR